MTENAQRWSDVYTIPLTLEAIRALHMPPSQYRISPKNYEAHIVVPGVSIAGRLYVLSGACVKTVGAWSVSLGAGMFADFPEGDYQIEVCAEQGVQLVYVWPIPAQ